MPSLILTLVISLAASPDPVPPPRDVALDPAIRKELIEIREAAEMNRMSFQKSGSFVYEVGNINSENFKEVRDGKGKGAIPIACTYEYDGKRASHTHVYPEAVYEAAIVRDPTRPNVETSFLHSFRAITDGKHTLHSRHFGAPPKKPSLNLTEGRQDFDQAAEFPLDLGIDDAHNNVNDYLKAVIDKPDDFAVGKFDTKAVFEGTPVTLIQIDSLKYPGMSSIFYVDRKRGCLSLCVEDVDKNRSSKSTTVYRDIRSIEGRGWLPFRRVWYFDDKTFGRVTQITEAKFGAAAKTPEQALFFPAPISLYDVIHQFAHDPRPLWSLDDLSATGGQPVR